jgi:tRNA modification GTPase
MNRLLEKERSIVTAVPGTTRDFIEEAVNIRGIPLRLIDTAGLHDTENPLEAAGIRFTRRQLDEADLVLFMVDCSSPVGEGDMAVFSSVSRRKTILVVNKTDLGDEDSIRAAASHFPDIPRVEISALYNRGIDALKNAIFREITHQASDMEVPSVVPNLRHKLTIERALNASREVVEGLSAGRPAELVAVDLKEAFDALGEIIGATTTEEILDQIFNRFCIGK